MSRERKLLKNTIILFIGTFLPKLASFITLPILTARLTKEEYGIYDLIAVLVSLLLPAATLQIQTSAFRFLIDSKDDKNEIKSIVTTIFLFIFPVSLVSLVILWIVLPVNNYGIKAFICGYFFIDIIVNTTRHIARGMHKNIDYSISAIISAFCKMIFTVLFVMILDYSLLGATISLFISSVISWIVIAYRIKLYDYFDVSTASWNQLKKLLSYSWPMVPNSMSMWVMRLSDRLVVTAFMGLAWNAVYAVSNKIPSLLNLAQSSFSLAWQENASIVSKDQDAVSYYSKMFRTMFDLMAGILGILICMTPILFKIFVRGDYGDAYCQMPILFLAQFFFGMSTFLGGIYVAYMKTKSVGITTTVAGISNLLIDLIAIKWIGLYAASGSTLFSYMFLFFFRMIDIRKFIQIKYEIGHLFMVFFILIIEACLCYINRFATNVFNMFLCIIVFFILNQKIINTVLKSIFNKINKITQ